MLVAVGVKVLVTVNVGVRVNVGGRFGGTFASSCTVGAVSRDSASVGSGVSPPGSSTHAAIAANAALIITVIAKSATRRIKPRLLSCASILKG